MSLFKHFQIKAQLLVLVFQNIKEAPCENVDIRFLETYISLEF